MPASQRPQPGDLIKAADWVALEARLAALQVRVEDLESGGSRVPPTIVDVLPHDTRTEDDIIDIFGRNFGYSEGAHSVIFGGKRAEDFPPGSSDTHLRVRIPTPVPGATAAGVPITMTVSNRFGFTTWAIPIKSKVETPTGGLGLSYQGSTPATPNPGDRFTLRFDLVSGTNLDTVVTIAPSAVTANGAPLVPPNTIEIQDSQGRLISNRQISLPEGRTVSFQVSIPSIPSQPDVEFQVVVTASAPGLTSVSENVTGLTVGHEAEQPDDTVDNWSFSGIEDGENDVSFEASTTGNIEGTFTIAAQATILMALGATFNNIPAGQTYEYEVQAAVEPTGTGWVARVHAPTTPYQVASPGSFESPLFEVVAPSSGNPATIVFSTQRETPQGTTLRRQVRYRVQLS